MKPFWTKPCTHHFQRSINYPWSLRSTYNVGTHAVWIAAIWGQFCLPDLPDGIPPTFSPCSAACLSGASNRYSMKVTSPACVHACGGMLGGSEAQMSAPALSFCLLAPGDFLFSLVRDMNPSKSKSDQVNPGESKSS